MIEIWQLVIIVMTIWGFYELTRSPINTRNSDQLFKHLINSEIAKMINREEQMRIRLGLEPVIK